MRKLNRKLLRRLLYEEAETVLSADKEKQIDDRLAAYLDSEGGAAGEEDTEGVASGEDGAVDGKAYLSKSERYKQMKSGDYYDTEQLAMSEARKLIRRTILNYLR